MHEHTQAYQIRPGTPEDLSLLPEIIRASEGLFRSTPYGHLLEGRTISVDIDLERDRFWVAVDGAAPVGVVTAIRRPRSVHVDQLSAHPAHGRRGLGARLLDAVARWARSLGTPALTLTTFADIPWNGPYYERMGFRTLSAAELTAELTEMMRHEAEFDIPMAHRIAMRRDL